MDSAVYLPFDFSEYFHPSSSFSMPQAADLYDYIKTILTSGFQLSLDNGNPQSDIGGKEASKFIRLIPLALAPYEGASG